MAEVKQPPGATLVSARLAALESVPINDAQDSISAHVAMVRLLREVVDAASGLDRSRLSDLQWSQLLEDSSILPRDPQAQSELRELIRHGIALIGGTVGRGCNHAREELHAARLVAIRLEKAAPRRHRARTARLIKWTVALFLGGVAASLVVMASKPGSADDSYILRLLNSAYPYPEMKSHIECAAFRTAFSQELGEVSELLKDLTDATRDKWLLDAMTWNSYDAHEKLVSDRTMNETEFGSYLGRKTARTLHEIWKNRH